MNTSVRTFTAAVALTAAALPAHAQGPNAQTEPAAASESERLFASIDWLEGPDTARIGSESRVAVPKGCQFTAAAGARSFMLATENPPSGSELGVLICPTADESDQWFVVFSFDNSGYVRDNDASELDADAILSTLRAGNENGNKDRVARGWAALTLDGWVRAPYYDLKTNNLTWSTKVSDVSGSSVNHSVRLLGRGGVMHADLVIDPAQFEGNIGAFDRVVASHSFLPGRRYSEWREGDKLAGYGLTALVAGGAGVVAAKSGLLGKLFKLIAVAVVGIGAWLKSLFTGRKRQDEPAA